jgi:uncharacterized protein DUF4410
MYTLKKKLIIGLCLGGGVLFSLLVEGCASASVRSTNQTKAQFYAPKIIYVQDYQFNPKEVAVDRSGPELVKFRAAVTAQFTKNLQQAIQKNLVDCQILPANKSVPQGPYWLVTGRFDKVYQGSRVLRALFGFGLGKTRLDITTHIYALSEGSRKLLYTIKTTGSSGGMPGALPGLALGPVGAVGAAGTAGAITAVNAANAAATGALQSGTSGLSFDTKRSAREITAAISEYLHMNGAFLEKKRLHVKREGHF